ESTASRSQSEIIQSYPRLSVLIPGERAGIGRNGVLFVSGWRHQLADGTRRGFRIVRTGSTFVMPVIEKANCLEEPRRENCTPGSVRQALGDRRPCLANEEVSHRATQQLACVRDEVFEGWSSPMKKCVRLTRREFLKTSSAALGTISLVPRHVLGGQGYTSPNETLTKAVIGVGGMGQGHLKSINPTSKLLAICDVDEKHLEHGLELAGPGVKGYKDFREVIERKDIDIVHIPTPPHWHALISIAAAKAGKDIWCEKPMSRTIAEGEAVRDAVAKYQRIFRLNTWFRFQDNFYGMGVRVKMIKKVVQSGLLGWPLKVTVGGTTGFAWKQDQWCGRTHLVPQPVPPELDY